MTRPDLDAIRARCDMARDFNDFESVRLIREDIPALLAYITELERALGASTYDSMDEFIAALHAERWHDARTEPPPHLNALWSVPVMVWGIAVGSDAPARVLLAHYTGDGQRIIQWSDPEGHELRVSHWRELPRQPENWTDMPPPEGDE